MIGTPKNPHPTTASFRRVGGVHSGEMNLPPRTDGDVDV